MARRKYNGCRKFYYTMKEDGAYRFKFTVYNSSGKKLTDICQSHRDMDCFLEGYCGGTNFRTIPKGI